jgi:hypothetical protein
LVSISMAAMTCRGTLKRFILILAPFDLYMVQSWPVFGSDTGGTLAGLPGILLQQETAGYQFSHHSGADTLDKVDESTLAKNAAVEAILAFWIADRFERFASPWRADQTKKMLVDRHQKQYLKGLSDRVRSGVI